MCGFVGIVGQPDCAADILVGLQALQHRGQDSAGVGTIFQDEFPIVRRLGLVGQSFGREEILQLPGRIGIGHTRYPTLGSGSLRDAQPFFYRRPGVLMAHNGNFINIPEMHCTLADESVHLLSHCDVEPVLCIFALELMRRRRRDHTVEDAIEALRATFKQARGAYSIAIALVLDGRESLVAVRDPRGIRPAVWGVKDGSYLVASESVALDALDASLQGNIAPGEIMIFQHGRDPIHSQLGPAKSFPCIFEYIYFARPDSVMNGHSVYGIRLELGRALAKAWQAKGYQADVVIPIPDTSRPSANALAESLGLPFREGFIKNRYTGRTFIMSSADERSDALKLKLNPIRSEFAGRKVLVVDDSIVRGTTLLRTIQLIRDQGPTQVHLAIHSPPVIHPCYYGIDMSTREELAAPGFLTSSQNRLTEAEQTELEKRLADRLSLDSLTYLTVDGLKTAFPDTCCAACFDGNYPLSISEEDRKWIEKDRRSCYQRELLL